MAVKFRNLVALRNESLRTPDIQVVFTPDGRQRHITQLLELDGLGDITEDPHAAYCFVSLTNTPGILKPVLRGRQDQLMTILQEAGITAYDPATAPYSPDTNLHSSPDEVYLADSGKIAGARLFVGHNLLPSSGQGVEAEKAKNLLRLAVIFMDKRIRVSRMQPSRTIYLAYDDFDGQRETFVEVFQFLQQFEIGVGFHHGNSVLLGFRENEPPIDLQEEIYRMYPELVYTYDGGIPTAQFDIKNPEIFSELD